MLDSRDTTTMIMISFQSMLNLSKSSIASSEHSTVTVAVPITRLLFHTFLALVPAFLDEGTIK